MKIGIALSGGGIRGIAHAGVLKALEENNIKMQEEWLQAYMPWELNLKKYIYYLRNTQKR